MRPTKTALRVVLIATLSFAAGAVRADGAADGLARIIAIHGAAGPWAVAGYRMGVYALRKLGLEWQSFDLIVEHHSPAKVEYSCIADGAAAATGASVGKLNLARVDADAAHVVTIYRKKSTGQSVALRPAASFVKRFASPSGDMDALGRQVMALPDGAIFEETK